MCFSSYKILNKCSSQLLLFSSSLIICSTAYIHLALSRLNRLSWGIPVFPVKAATVAVEAAASHGHYAWALNPQIQLVKQGVSTLPFSPILSLCVGSQQVSCDGGTWAVIAPCYIPPCSHLHATNTLLWALSPSASHCPLCGQ